MVLSLQVLDNPGADYGTKYITGKDGHIQLTRMEAQVFIA